MEVEQKVKKIISEIFEVPEEDIVERSSPETIEKWDSLSHMNMVLALEEEFNIRIDDDQIVEMLDYELICITVSKYLAG